MKTAGIIILGIGILVTIFTGFKFVTKKKVVDIGKLEISKEEDHSFAWSPVIGIAIMVVGGGVLLYGAKKGA